MMPEVPGTPEPLLWFIRVLKVLNALLDLVTAWKSR
jgi:hypothetical protein